MPYVLKYSYQFVSALGDNCEVQFYINNPANTNHTRLNPGAKPFVLKEFNSDNNLFKPIRPFQAEMEFLSNNVSIEDFLFDDDDACKVVFLFNGENFWTGWLVQDDFQENWIDTNHYITLRATDALGQIGSQSLTLASGKYTMLEYLSECLQNTTIGNVPTGQVLINNLFYLGMNNRTNGVYTPLDQVKVDLRTFLDKNKLQVLETINKAWSMTTFQYYTKYWFIRLEEFLNNNLLKGIVRNGTNPTFSKSFEVNVGVNQSVKPMMPEMIKSMRRPFKETKIIYKYEFFKYIINNQDFQSGSTTAFPDRFTVNDWTLYKDNFNRSVAGTALWYREVIKDANDNILDNYVNITAPSGAFNFMTRHFLVCQPVVLNANDSFSFEIDFKIKEEGLMPSTFNIGYIVFEDILGDKYMLGADGSWINTSNYTTNITPLVLTYSSYDKITKWKTFKITSNSVSNQGNLYVYLLHEFNYNISVNFKNIKITMNDNTKKTVITGDYDTYEITSNVNQNDEEETYLDDANNRQYKGALFFNDQLTVDNWYRMDYPTERLTFKRHKAIAQMFLNRRLRRFLQVNMFGNVWLDKAVRKPIWLMNKFVFVDDDPNRKWMIANLSEIDFMEATWNGQLVEVWGTGDPTVPDFYPPHDFGNIYG